MPVTLCRGLRISGAKLANDIHFQGASQCVGVMTAALVCGTHCSCRTQSSWRLNERGASVSLSITVASMGTGDCQHSLKPGQTCVSGLYAKGVSVEDDAFSVKMRPDTLVISAWAFRRL